MCVPPSLRGEQVLRWAGAAWWQVTTRDANLKEIQVGTVPKISLIEGGENHGMKTLLEGFFKKAMLAINSSRDEIC